MSNKNIVEIRDELLASLDISAGMKQKPSFDGLLGKLQKLIEVFTLLTEGRGGGAYERGSAQPTVAYKDNRIGTKEGGAVSSRAA